MKNLLEEEDQKEIKERGDGHDSWHQPGEKIEQDDSRLLLREDMSNCNLPFVFLLNIRSCKKGVVDNTKYRGSLI